MKNSRPNGGFTLIELVVAVALSALLLVGVFQMMFRTISGGGRASELADVKEQGDFMITAIERLVRPAKSCTNAGTDTILIVTNTDGSNVQVQNNGGVIVSVINSNTSPLHGDDIEVVNANFVCSSSTNSFEPDSVDISFSIKPKNTNIAPEIFKTSINLRNS